MIRSGARALNKPMLILGLDRKLAGLAFILAVVVGANGSRIASVILFMALCTLGRRLSRRDPNIFVVLNRIRRQRALHDPMKREWFRLVLERKAG